MTRKTTTSSLAKIILITTLALISAVPVFAGSASSPNLNSATKKACLSTALSVRTVALQTALDNRKVALNTA
ncbi:MAG: hypothetical protein PHF79_03730, partial [Candidatus Pacebacteria bacterium]|nr:hypothetical protein [Candidatus Paceibacterota bacterium]